MEDQPAEVVQPPEGQGDVGGEGSPYASYLERIPEEARDVATEAFKAWDGDVTRRFQEASEFKKGWEPYEQAGINQYDPQALAEHLQMLQNPQQVVEWARTIAEQNGIQLAPEQPPPPEFQYDGTAYQDPQQQFEQLLEQRLTPLQQQVQQFEQQQRVNDANRYIEGQLAELEQKHGGEFNREMVEQFAGKYVESDPLNAIPKGWEDWQKVRNDIEKQALQRKVDAPAPAEGGGVPDVTQEKAKSLQDPSLAAMATQILRNNRSA